MFRSSSVLLMTFKAPVDRFILKKLCSNHEKTKTTLPYQEQYVKEAYTFIVVFTVVGASMLFFLFFFWCDNFVFIYLLIFFVQTSTNVFVGYTNAALMRFATIPKVHTIAHAKMDSREMDENVKVSVGFISDYAIKR